MVLKLMSGSNARERSRHRKLIKEEFQTLKIMHDRDPVSTCSVIRPIMLFEEHLAHISQYVNAGRLDEILLEKTSRSFTADCFRRLEHAFYNAGKWLSAFSEEFTTSVCTKKFLDNELSRMLTTDLNSLSNRYISRHVRGLMIRIRNGLQDDELKLSKCHGDFIPSNLLMGNDKIYVTDFSDQHEGLIYEDIARLYQWLEDYRARRPWVDKGQISGLQAAFLEGVFEERHCEVQALFFYRALYLLKAIASLRHKPIYHKLTISKSLMTHRERQLEELLREVP